MEKSQRHNAGYKVDMRRATCVERGDLLHVVFAAKFKIAMTDIAGGWELALNCAIFTVVHQLGLGQSSLEIAVTSVL